MNVPIYIKSECESMGRLNLLENQDYLSIP